MYLKMGKKTIYLNNHALKWPLKTTITDNLENVENENTIWMRPKVCSEANSYSQRNSLFNKQPFNLKKTN